MNNFRSAVVSGKGLHAKNPLVSEKKGRGAETDDLSSVEVSRHEERSANHRDDDRHRLDQEAVNARFGRKEYAVELINLSGGGAMIRADFKPRLWERVDLVFAEGAEIECAVRWLRDDRIGLEFAHETRIDCNPEQRDALLLDVLQRNFPNTAIKPRRETEDSSAQSVGAAKGDDVANTRRTERRHPLIWKGEIFYNHDRERVRLRNISENGALVESPIAYPLGAEVLLDLFDAGQHFGTVSWAFGDKVGLKFAQPFDLKKLGSAKPDVAPAMMIRPGPSVSADQDNPWAEGWNRQSINELRDDLEGFLKR